MEQIYFAVINLILGVGLGYAWASWRLVKRHSAEVTFLSEKLFYDADKLDELITKTQNDLNKLKRAHNTHGQR